MGWVLRDGPRREIQRRFRVFLLTFKNQTNQPQSQSQGQGSLKYPALIEKMCRNNSASLHVSYSDLSIADEPLAVFIADIPTEMLEILDAALMDVILQPAFFPDYKNIHDTVHVRKIMLFLVSISFFTNLLENKVILFCIYCFNCFNCFSILVIIILIN